ncbi:MAG: TIGR01777 family oxidoreductase [Actinomycetota bacterium]|nr:TIGR01777 family oxidoreductase [Actinomycetota bacterium]
MLKGYQEDARRLRVLISGASGMIGTPLQALLRQQGHAVHTLVRRTPRDASEHSGNPATGEIEAGILDHTDVVINLAAASISRWLFLGRTPWAAGQKRDILTSRLGAARTLATAISGAKTPPSLLIQASAVGFYGDRASEELTERSSRGEGFLAEVQAQAEAAASEAESDVTRICYPRSAAVMGKGALSTTLLKLQTALGLGGPIGDGSQWWPWISLHDEVRALAYLANHETAFGVFNLVSPTPASALDQTKALARGMKRPHWLGFPRFAIVALMGEAGKEILLTSQRVIPERLLASGFKFEDQTLEAAVSRLLQDD